MSRQLRIVLVLLAGAAACGDPAGPEDSDGVFGEWVRVEGVRRDYSLFVPSGYDPATPAPLVIALHSFGGTGRGFIALTGLDAAAQRRQAIAVFPNGIEESWTYGCDCTAADAAGVDDVAFLSVLVDHLTDSLTIDRDRIFLTGFSQGGFLALRAACEQPDAYAGVGVVGATMTPEIAAACAPTPPLPALFVLGTADDLVPYNGGRADIWSAFETRGFWTERNTCPGTPETVSLPDTADDGTSITRSTWAPCAQESAVVLYTVTDGGHTWPGALQELQPFLGRASRDMEASEEILRFFLER